MKNSQSTREAVANDRTAPYDVQAFTKGMQTIFLRLQGKLANYLPSFTTAWLTTCGQFLYLICPGKALAKTTNQEPSIGDSQLISMKILACVTLNKSRKSVKQLLHL